MLSLRAFEQTYRKSVSDVFRFWTPQMQSEIARHCRGWAPGLFDFEQYLTASAKRYYLAWESLAADGASRVCDVGGFWGAFPVTLSRLGFSAAMTETLGYYGDSFSPLFAYIREQGVEILDYDPFADEGKSTPDFDAVTLMAVIEHYPHSLARLMENVIALLRDGALLYIEVPNIAYWPKRLALLRGRSPLVPAQDIFHSDVPFIGHHHEFTMDELKDLVSETGLLLERDVYYSYSLDSSPNRPILRRALQSLLERLLPDTAECLAVCARRREKN